MQKAKVYVGLGLVGLVALGCGGGGGSSSPTPGGEFTITWAARARDITGPSAAKSFKLIGHGAKPGGGDYVFTGNRPSGTAQVTSGYKTQNSWALVPTDITFEFYADADAKGALVAYGTANVTPTSGGITVPDVSLVSVITKVVVPPQSVDPSRSKDLTYTPYDSTDKLVPVSFGSAIWTTSDETVLSFDKGKAVPKNKSGHVNVVATVDGVSSVPSPIAIQPPIATLTIFDNQKLKLNVPHFVSFVGQQSSGLGITLTQHDVTWTSLDPSILKVNSDSTITGLAEGAGHLQATYLNPNGLSVKSKSTVVTVVP